MKTRLLPFVLAAGALLAACGDTYDRAEFIEEMTTGDAPITEAQANCIADGVEEEFGIDRLNDRGDLTSEEEAILTDLAFECVLGS